MKVGIFTETNLQGTVSQANHVIFENDFEAKTTADNLGFVLTSMHIPENPNDSFCPGVNCGLPW